MKKPNFYNIEIYLFLFLQFCIVKSFSQRTEKIEYLTTQKVKVSPSRAVKMSIINTNNGLSQNSIQKIIQDKEGYIWIATQTGLEKYDGNKSKPIILENKKLNEEINLLIECSRINKILAVTRQNLYIIDKNSFTVQIKNLTEIVNIDFIENKKKNIFLISTREMVYLIDTNFRNKKIIYKSKINISNTSLLSNNRIFITHDKGIVIYDFKNKKSFDLIKKTNFKVNSILKIPSEKKIYFIENKQNLFKYEEDSINISKINLPLSIANNSMNVLLWRLSENERIVWIGTDRGIFGYDIDRKNVFELLSSDNNGNYIKNNKIISLLESRDKVMWIGTWARGIWLYQYYTQEFKRNYGLNTIEKRNNHVWAIYPLGKDFAYVGVEGKGIMLINSATNTIEKKIGYNSQLSVYCFVSPNFDDVYTGTNEGIFKISKYHKLEVIKNFSKENVRALAYNNKRKEWIIGEKRGDETWIVFTDENFNIKDSKLIDSNNSSIFSIKIYSDNNEEMIILGGTFGLRTLSLDKKILRNVSNEQILNIYINKRDTIWLATSRGLKVLKLKDYEEPKLFISSVPQDVIYSIIEDKSENLWLSSNHGIYRVNTKDSTTNSYSLEDGLQELEFNVGAFAYVDSPTEKIYFGGVKGVNYFKPINSIKHSSTSEPCYFEVEYIKDGISSNIIILDNSIKVFQDVNYIRVKPQIFNFHNISNNQFRFRLVGEKDWKYLNKDEMTFVITYNSNNEDNANINLKYPLYKRIKKNSDLLEYQYRNSYLSWSKTKIISIEKEKSYDLILILLLTTLGIAVISYFYIRNKKLRRIQNILQQKEKERKRIERDEKEILKNKEFEKSQEELKIYNKIIEISRFNILEEFTDINKATPKKIDINKVWIETGKFFINTEIKSFNFDFCVVSLINFSTNKIESKFVESVEGKIEDENIPYWKKKSIWHLDRDKDILPLIGKRLKPVIVINKDIIDKYFKEGEEPITEKNLSSKVFQKLKHQNFARIFFPIVYRGTYKNEIFQSNKYNPNNDIPLGVIELGFIDEKISLYNSVKENYKKILDEKEKDFSLLAFLENVSRQYYSALINNASYSLKDKINKYFKDTKVTLQDQLQNCRPSDKTNLLTEEDLFLNLVLKELVTEFAANYGLIALSTFNSENIDITEKNIFYSNTFINENTNYKFEDIRKASHKHESNIVEYVYTNKRSAFFKNAKKEPAYVTIFSDINSELAVPLFSFTSPNELLGIIVLGAERINNFSSFHIDIIESVSESISEKYLNKKLNASYQSLAEAFNAFPFYKGQTNESILWKTIINTLKDYFESDYISLWRRNHTSFTSNKINNKFKLIKQNTTKELYKLYTDCEFFKEDMNNLGEIEKEIQFDFKEKNTLQKNIIEKETNLVELQNISDYHNPRSSIYQFCASESVNFKNYIILRIHIENKFEAFINIFSKKELVYGITTKDKTFCLQVINKATLALQSIKVFQAIENVSTVLSDEFVDTSSIGENKYKKKGLIKITQSVFNLLNAEAVTLFFDKKNEYYKVENSVKVGKITDEDEENITESVNLANRIYNTNGEKIIFIKSEKDYNTFRNIDAEETIDSSSFWKFNNIETIVACRVEHNEQILGILLIYFSNPFEDTEVSKALINSFMNFISIALFNFDKLFDLKNQKWKLVEEEIRLKNEKENLEKIIEEQNIKVEKSNNTLKEMEIAISHQERQYLKLTNEFDSAEQRIINLLPKVTRVSFFEIIKGLNHQFKHALYNISTNISRLNNLDSKFNDQQKKILQDSTNEVNKRIRGIRNLISLFNFDESSSQEFSLSKLTFDVIDYFHFFNIDDFIDFKVNLENESADNIIANKAEMTMILHNLISNAIYAIGEKKKQYEKVSEKYKGEIIIVINFHKSDHFISVYDNGTGINSEIEDQIFDYEFTTKANDGGTGIGLYFVKMIITKQYKGKVEYTTKFGKSTTFTLTFPIEKLRK